MVVVVVVPVVVSGGVESDSARVTEAVVLVPDKTQPPVFAVVIICYKTLFKHHKLQYNQVPLAQQCQLLTRERLRRSYQMTRNWQETMTSYQADRSVLSGYLTVGVEIENG